MNFLEHLYWNQASELEQNFIDSTGKEDLIHYDFFSIECSRMYRPSLTSESAVFVRFAGRALWKHWGSANSDWTVSKNLSVISQKKLKVLLRKLLFDTGNTKKRSSWDILFQQFCCHRIMEKYSILSRTEVHKNPEKIVKTQKKRPKKYRVVHILIFCTRYVVWMYLFTASTNRIDFLSGFLSGRHILIKIGAMSPCK